MNNVAPKAVKNAKPVSKTAGKVERSPAGPAVKKTAAKARARVSVPRTAAKPVAKDAVRKVTVKPNAVNTLASKPQTRKAPAAKSKVTPSAPRPAVKPAAVKSNDVRNRGKVVAGVSRVSPPVHPSVQIPARPAVVARPIPIKKDPRLVNNWKIKPVEQWTDDEVICMPDEEYMSDKQLAFFRLKLLRLKNDILTSAGETTEHLRSDTVVVPDPADRATIEEEHALELRTRDRERKLLRKIEQSIARIDAGDYGYCDETGEPIGVARLLARPTATLSLEAQQRRELKQKLFGD
jgi:DnaK suppressor protein